MQDESSEFQNTFAIQAGVVGGAILLLIIIIVYLHFDAKITKFFEDSKSAWRSLVKVTKAKISYNVRKTQNSAKRRVMAKLQIIRGNFTIKDSKPILDIDVCLAFKIDSDKAAAHAQETCELPNGSVSVISSKAASDMVSTAAAPTRLASSNGLTTLDPSSLPNGFQSNTI